MKINFIKVHENTIVPLQAYKNDAGMDITAVEVEKSGNWLFPLYTYRTGLAMEIPPGYFLMLVPRSSLSKKLMWMANHIGIIDANYRGEILFKFRSILGIKPYKIDDRIGQMILRRGNKIELNEVDKLTETTRGKGSFGSSGN